jgi:uncharacterized protein YbgA (DUF1722 family)/uncharacterized protein YbbK (DUF523 family)
VSNNSNCDTFFAKTEESGERIRLGISRCLLGENVRYDGGHKLDRYLTSVLGPYVEYVPVCPEVECGMSIPREALRLVGDPESPRLMTQKTARDYTEQMQDWGARRLQDLEKEGLCGYIFKSRSPSSGMQRIKVYQENGQPLNKGVGIWAKMVMDHFPLLAFEDEGRLNDLKLRENFIERIFVLKRWRDMIRQGKQIKNLIDFHTRHKLLLLAHSPEVYRQMGRLVSQAKEFELEELFCRYINLLHKAMSLKTTTKKNLNVLQHMLGYFKKDLSRDEKQELLEIFEHYAQGNLPLIVPVTLINHYVRKYNQPYLQEQFYLKPHPLELRLRNHA